MLAITLAKHAKGKAMKLGKTLVELATEIERQKASKKDYLAPVTRLELKSNGVSTLDLGADSPLVVGEIAHEQIAEKVGIPKKYYDRLKAEAPELLDRNVNYWFHTPKKNAQGDILPTEQVMLRTLDNKVRGVLSNKFRPLDNADFAEAVLPILGELDLMIVSAEITEKRLYIKAVDRKIERDIPSGAKMGDGHTIFNTLSPAITLSNSEIGYGSLAVVGSVWTRQCTNLATFAERSMRKYHTGTRFDSTEEISELLTDETRALTDRATWAQVRDMVRAAFDRAKFDALVDTLEGTTQQKLGNDVIKVIESTSKLFNFREEEKNSVLKHLITGGDLTRYGLHSAITRTAEDLESYDRASELERIGGNLIFLPEKDWKSIAHA